MELFDTPPGRNPNRDWNPFDEAILILIDNPGKWGIVETRTNVKDRTTTHLKGRVGKGFEFRTNEDEGVVNVWACYHAEETP